jgi:hypothetical protein
MKHMLVSKQYVVVALLTAGLAVACNDTTLPTAPTTAAATSSTTTTTTTSTATNGAACATGDGVNDACSCDGDTQLYCAGFYSADWQSYARANGYTTSSWKYGLLDCLGKHTVSTACTASLSRREALNAQMMASCATYCRGTSPQPGSEPCVDKLKSIYTTLDNACRSALDAHEAAKPLNSGGPF